MELKSRTINEIEQLTRNQRKEIAKLCEMSLKGVEIAIEADSRLLREPKFITALGTVLKRELSELIISEPLKQQKLFRLTK